MEQRVFKAWKGPERRGGCRGRGFVFYFCRANTVKVSGERIHACERLESSKGRRREGMYTASQRLQPARTPESASAAVCRYVVGAPAWRVTSHVVRQARRCARACASAVGITTMHCPASSFQLRRRAAGGAAARALNLRCVEGVGRAKRACKGSRQAGRHTAALHRRRRRTDGRLQRVLRLSSSCGLAIL